MICVRLMGGLGNQMFQYACGKALAERRQTELLLDCSFLQVKDHVADFTVREYELDVFKISAKKIDSTELSKFNPSFFYLGYYHLSKRIGFLPFIKVTYFLEQKQFKYDKTIETVANKCLLIGHWQNERYFKKIESLILKDFTFKKPLDQNNSKMANRIEASNAISIHIRRGDFVNNPNTFKTHGLCSLEYYQKAIYYIKQKINNPVFFIFSDEIEWVKKNLTMQDDCEFISGNIDENSYIDMQLMSICKHNIIANSTFSWWGAWINKNPTKIVVAPKQWFLNDDLNKLAKNLIPETWIRL